MRPELFLLREAEAVSAAVEAGAVLLCEAGAVLLCEAGAVSTARGRSCSTAVEAGAVFSDA